MVAIWLRVTAVLALALSAGCASRHVDVTPETAKPSVSDLLTWEPNRVWGFEAKGAVLDWDVTRQWMSSTVGLPTVLDRDGKILMWFVGYQGGHDPSDLIVKKIGLAESLDGLRFSIANEGRPVLGPGLEGQFDSHSVSHPFVVEGRDAGGRPELWMYYAGCDGRRSANQVRVEQIGLAKSRDGATWTRAQEDPVVANGRPGEIDSIQAAGPFVLRRGGRFEMWYGAYDGKHRIAFATSEDGVVWTKHGAVSGLRGPDAGEVGPSVDFDGTRYLMFYNSVEGTQWLLYAATSTDGENWVPAHGGQPAVADAPAWSFAYARPPGNNSCVHLSNLLFRPGMAHAWYMGEDESTQRIGLLKFSRKPTAPGHIEDRARPNR